MAAIRDQAVVLRTQKLGEADRIITLLTPRTGLRRAVARGVRKSSSKFGARLEPFSVVDILCYEGRGGLDTVTQAESLAIFGTQLSGSLETYNFAHAMAEVATQLAADSAAAAHQYHLLVRSLQALAQGEIAQVLVRDSYFLRALSLAGWSLELRRCVHCNIAAPPLAGVLSENATPPENLPLELAVSVQLGGLVCNNCAAPGNFRVEPAVIALLAALLAGDFDLATHAPNSARTAAGEIILAFLNWQLEKRIRSLN
ncbi:MAG: DNA repair protein RecO [Microbacteriaceae bacterium]|nr:DNA repair protein RecO [Microbacteriaceae bacterium]